MRLVHIQHDSLGGAEVKMSVSTVEDLWHLFNFITVGDIVRTKTVRKVVKETSTGSGASEKRVMKLNVLIQNIDFDPLGELRLSGVNRTESEFVKLNAHHTLSIRVENPQDVEVYKSEWDSLLQDRITEACNQEGKADTAAIAIDFGLANVCLVTPSLMVTKAKIECTISKKHRGSGSHRDESIGKFFQQVLDALLQHINFEIVKVVLLCSPGHVREEFMSFILTQAQRFSDVPGPMKTLLQNKSKFVLVKVSSGYKHSINEALADRNVVQRMQDAKCSNDLRVWQEFQDMMNTNPDRACYTPQYVFAAQSQGAIDKLLVSDALFRTQDVQTRRFYISLVETVKACAGHVIVFSSHHVTGEQLTRMSGIAAILRHPMPELDELEVDPNFLSSEAVNEMIREASSNSHS